MKNIHVLPTDKPSRLFLNKVNKKIILEDISNPNLKKVLPSGSYQDIYITSDEEISISDYITDGYRVWKWKDDSSLLGRKKIILTTDQDLIKNGVQAIDDEFLEWFVKNPSCEEVDVEESNLLNTSRTYLGVDKYKIIIPKEIGFKMENGKRTETFYSKEEPKQETLEEVAERYAISKSSSDVFKEAHIRDFMAGAKWQQEQDKNKYSEEDLKEAFQSGFTNGFNINSVTFEEWFEQFKNK
jgi:hypothetical protein